MGFRTLFALLPLVASHLIRDVESSVQDVTAFAINVSRPALLLTTALANTIIQQYGYPLLLYVNFVEPYLNTSSYNIGTNAALVRRTFYPANTTTPGVRVNTDTLYNTGITDLSKDNVEITFPEPVDDRFYSLSYYDVYVPITVAGRNLCAYRSAATEITF
jgi:hypothetical protein